jgi:hypothetical protein
MDDARLDAALRELAVDVHFPPTPDLRQFVAGRLTRPGGGWRLRPAWRLAVVAAIVATLVIVAAVAAIAFGLPGLRILLVPEVPPSASVPAHGERLGLGAISSLDAAADGFDGGMALPAAIGQPDEVYLASDGSVVSLVYHADDALPSLAGSELGLLVMEVSGRVDRDQIEKLVPGVGASVTAVDVDGAPGFWIEGNPHVMRYRDPSGATGELVSRLVGDVLVWQRGDTLYRIETALGYEETLRIAESMAAAP